MRFRIGNIIRTRIGVYFFPILLACIFICNATYAQEEIKLNKEKSGLYTIPCEVNGLRLRFILDTGATDVSISLTEASFMYKNGYLEDEDFLGTAKTLIASGEVQEDYLINIKQIKVGTKVLNNIKASVVKGLSAPLLLGQSVLSQLGEWSIRGDFLILFDRGGNDYSTYNELDWKKRIEETESNGGKWDESIKYLMPGVLADDYNTIIAVGQMLVFAHNIDKKIGTKDEAIIIEKLKKLADADDKTAIFEIADYYEATATSMVNIEKAKCLYEKLIDGKTLYLHPSSFDSPYIKLYDIYKKHYNQPLKAMEYLQKGAVLNESTCMIYLFEIYDDEKQYNNLYQWTEKLSRVCTGGAKNKAIYWKAKCLLEGKGVKRNAQLGVQLLEQLVYTYKTTDEDAIKYLCEHYLVKGKFEKLKECAQKISFLKFYKYYYWGCACYYLKDYSSARMCFKHLWDKDRIVSDDYMLGMASCLLGQCYEDGLGGAISYKDAEKCYMYAYETCNYFAALGYLGDMLSNDKIYQTPNYETAFGCYLQGAKNNDAYCCYRVSLCYKLGVGITENMKESEYWFQKAKENGWKEE